MGDQIRISVIIPTYNRRRMLEDCLQSVLSQQYPASGYEVIVVDDGSADGTREFLREREAQGLLRAIYQPRNRGPAAARNVGARSASGEILAFTDSDCLVPVDWLARMDGLFAAHPGCAGVGGVQVPIRARTRVERFLYAKARLDPQAVMGVYQVTLDRFVSPVTNNVAYRKSDFEKLEGFSEAFRFPGGEDADINWRLLESGGQLLMDPTLTVQHHDPDTLLGLWRQARDRASGIFPTMARRKTARRRIVWTLVKQGGKFLLYVFPPLWPLVLVQCVRTARLNRRLLRESGGWREACGFLALLVVADCGEVVGFLSGVRHYYAARHREVVMPMRATDSGGA
jgi:glycosyltransferase involved in cell wall biosynthesis